MVRPARQAQSQIGEQFLTRLPRRVLYALILLAVAILAFVALRMYGFIKQFDDAVELLAGRYGVNSWLAKALAVGLFAPLAWGVKNGFFKIGRHTFRTKLLTGAYASLYFLGMYFVARNASFSHTTGEVLQWYAETPEGVRFFDSPGYDPKYGLPLRPVTPEMKVALARRQMGQTPNSVALSSFSQLKIFDPLTGAPQYWYYRSPSGEFEVFDGPGFHPQNQQLLSALTTEVVAAITRFLEERHVAATRENLVAYRSRYLDPASPPSGVRQWAVLITDANNNPVPALNGAASEALMGRGVQSASVFRPQFLRERLNHALYEGDQSLTERLGLNQVCDAVIVGMLRVDVTNNGAMQGMVTARASLRVRVVAASGSVKDEFDLASIGAGFSETAAQAQARERLIAPLKDRLAQRPL